MTEKVEVTRETISRYQARTTRSDAKAAWTTWFPCVVGVALSLSIFTSCDWKPSLTSQSNETPVVSHPYISTSVNIVRNEPFLKWAHDTREQIKNIDEDSAPKAWQAEMPFYTPRARKKVAPPNAEEWARIKRTTDLYANRVGIGTISGLLWTGVEPGNPLTRDESYRWNSLKESGLYVRDTRMKMIKTLRQLGVVNFRMGLSNHELDANKPATWKIHDEMMGDLSQGGLRLSLDMHHFGIEDRFRVVGANGKTDPTRSYYLNPEWPDYFGRFVATAFNRYRTNIKAVTLINEPETVVGFNAEMWHAAFPRWGSLQMNFWYIERAIQVAKATVKGRLAIEEVLSKLPNKESSRPFYMHTEAAVYKPYWQEFNRFVRYFTGDLMLGHEWFMNADIDGLERMPLDEIFKRWKKTPRDERTSFDWIIHNYIVENQRPAKREANRQRLVKLMRDLRALHLELKSKYGKTMRDETVMAVDYYAHNEDRGKNGKRLDPEPQYYVKQVISGQRSGLYRVVVDYYNHYKMPLMIGESGTVYYHFGSRWNQQMLLECADAAEDGVPFLGYTIYPGIDTWGWESALSIHRSKSILNPSGIMNFEMEPRPFMTPLLNSLRKHMADK